MAREGIKGFKVGDTVYTISRMFKKTYKCSVVFKIGSIVGVETEDGGVRRICPCDVFLTEKDARKELARGYIDAIAETISSIEKDMVALARFDKSLLNDDLLSDIIGSIKMYYKIAKEEADV